MPIVVFKEGMDIFGYEACYRQNSIFVIHGMRRLFLYLLFFPLSMILRDCSTTYFVHKSKMTHKKVFHIYILT